MNWVINYQKYRLISLNLQELRFGTNSTNLFYVVLVHSMNHHPNHRSATVEGLLIVRRCWGIWPIENPPSKSSAVLTAWISAKLLTGESKKHESMNIGAQTRVLMHWSESWRELDVCNKLQFKKNSKRISVVYRLMD
jgi:hypothetical protein